MKKRFILTGTDNDGYRHRYSVKKLEEFKQAFAKFMVDLGFDGEHILNRFFYDNADGIRVEVTIKNIEDECWNFRNKKYDVDLFFGRFKIILVIRTKKRVLMVEHLERKAGWIKPLSIKKIQEEKQKNKKQGIPLVKRLNRGKI